MSVAELIQSMRLQMNALAEEIKAGNPLSDEDVTHLRELQYSIDVLRVGDCHREALRGKNLKQITDRWGMSPKPQPIRTSK